MSLMEQAVDVVLWFGRFRLEEASERLVDLVTRAVAGESDALNTLVTRLEPKLRAVAQTRSRGSLQGADIDNVLQDSWVKLLKPGALNRFADKPEDLIPFLYRIVQNQTLSAITVKSRAERKHRSLDIDPISPGKAGTRGSGSRLSQAEKKVVRRAVTRALAKAKLAPQERLFVSMLFGVTTGGEMKLPDYGKDVTRAKLVGVKEKSISGWTSRTKQKFLQHFCTDKELCDLLPPGRARDKITRIKGLGQNACKGVGGSCMESDVVAFAHRVLPLVEDHPQIGESEAGELVLSWLTEVLAET